MPNASYEGTFPSWCGDVVRTLLEQVPAGMCRVEIDPPVEVHLPVAQQVEFLRLHARVAECNQRLAQMLGSSSPAELAGYRLGEVFLRSDPLQEKRLEAFVRAGYQLSNLESRDIDPAGNLRLFLYNLTGVLEDGRLTRIWGSVRDVTDLRRTEADNLRLAALTRENPNPVIETDAAGFVTTMNTAVRTVLQALQLDLADLLPPNHVDLVRACLESGQPIHEVEVAIRSRFLAWTYFPVVALGVVHLYALEITDRKRNEQILQHDALHDALTGLPNRALLHDRLERALQRAARHPDYLFAVLFVDLDRFKTVNDSLGHLAGDQLLIAVAERLQQCARRQDTVARVGGDEFVILQDDLRGVADATRLAERIQETLAGPITVSAQEVHTSASIGIALSSAGYARPEDLLRNADTAMYRAKTGGSGRFEVFDKAMHERAVAQQRLELDLRFALERDQLRVYYQPIVQAATGQVVSFEALARWQHPTRGLISPAEFIPLAEETGLIDPIARWVLEHVCHQNRAWREAGRPRVRISVNLSGRQIVQPTLAEGIHRILAAANLEPSALELEITESVAAKDPNQAVKTLEELRAAGIHVLIDDFGTGYSSLSQLKRFPIDGVKIDQSFIRDLGKDPAAAPMVTAVVSMAHALGFEVVAEGVETAEQLAFVRARGCDYLQGFYFARPAPAAEIERAWLRRE